MSIKASASVTLSSYRDTEAVTRYYKLVSSTSSAPSKPTTNPPSGWDDTEPSYTSGSTNTLYFCDLTKFSDGTWAYSAVSKSSSYEAAKEAYNKAQNAQDTANSANGKIDDLEIGGRNLWFKTKEYDASAYTGWVDNNIGSPFNTNAPYTTVNGFGVQRICEEWRDISQRVPIEPYTEYTLSAWIKWEDISSKMNFYDNYSRNSGTSITYQIGTDDYKRVSVTFNSGEGTVSTCRFECVDNTPYLIYGLKLEKGNKATDWTPAPEDMVDKANIVSCINQTPESITIQANKISLEGLITANSNFKILSDGSMETIAGKIGGWSIGNNKIYSENQLNVSLNNKVGTSYVSLVSDNSNNDEVISVVYDYLEDGVADDRTPGTDYVKIFNDGRLKLGSEEIWADDIPSIYTTEIKGSSITLTGSDQESFKCLITEQDITFSSSIGDTVSVIGSIYEEIWDSGLKSPFNNVASGSTMVVKLCKKGKLVTGIIFSVMAVGAANYYYTLNEFLIPAHMRPNENIYVNTINHASHSLTYGTSIFVITPEGRVGITTSNASWLERHACFSYWTK